ncbi:hypothetical protein EDD22DRAFT_847104 [Suillus occidentalis]|nr:hypothetical protein EDD22DRAFT_847104 [Suillus occidentalis]
MHFHTPPNSTRGSTPDDEVKDDLRHRTTRHSHGSEQDSPPALDSRTPCCSASRSIHSSMKRARSPSLDSTCDSSDDEINEPVTPPPIIRQLSRFVKRAKTDPKPFQRDVADAVDCLFLENQLSPDDSVNVDLEQNVQPLSDVAVAQAVVTMHAEVEFRRARALARAHQVNAATQRLRLLHIALEVEGEAYAYAASEPLETSIGEMAKMNKKDTRDEINLGVAAFSQDVMSFAVADSHFDHLEGICRRRKSNASTKSLTGDPLAYSRLEDSIDVG